MRASPSPPSRPGVRPLVVVLSVLGVIFALVAGAAGHVFLPILVNDAVKAYHFSQPAPPAPLASSSPVALRAQELVEEAGGASWTGSWVSSDRSPGASPVIEEVSGSFSFTDDGCASQVRRVYHSKDGGENVYEVVMVDGRVATRQDGGPWVESTFFDAMPVGPTLLSMYVGPEACGMLEEFGTISQEFAPLRPGATSPYDAPLPEGAKRYVAELDPTRFHMLNNYRTYASLEALCGPPTKRDVYLAESSVAAIGEKTDSVALEVDSSGSPLALRVAHAPSGRSSLSLAFTGLGVQDIEFPATSGSEPSPVTCE